MVLLSGQLLSLVLAPGGKGCSLRLSSVTVRTKLLICESSPVITAPTRQGGGDVSCEAPLSEPVLVRNITVREKRRLMTISKMREQIGPVSDGFIVDDLSGKFSRLHA